MDLGKFRATSLSLSTNRELSAFIRIPFADALFAQQAMTAAQTALREGKEISVNLSTVTRKRTLSQNAFAWVLMTRLAVKLRMTAEEVYEIMLQRYGVHAIYSVPAGAENIIKQHEHGVVFIGKSEANGQRYIDFKVVIGSSKYDTEQMTRFLDGIISECQDQGIDTEVEGGEQWHTSTAGLNIPKSPPP